LYGTKVFPIKLVLKKFLPFFENTNNKVRVAAFDLACELYRWLGDPMKGRVDTLRDAQARHDRIIFIYALLLLEEGSRKKIQQYFSRSIAKTHSILAIND
jgi:hypothetical protein